MTNTTPSLPQAVLTDAEIDSIPCRLFDADISGLSFTDELRAFARAIESAVLSRMGGEAVPAGWRNIATAPKHTEVLVWREDAGVFVARLTTPDAVVDENDPDGPSLDDFPDDYEEWWSDLRGWQEGGEKPTHWQPLPAAPTAPAQQAAPTTKKGADHA